MDAVNVLPAVVGELIPLAAIVFGIGVAFWAMWLGHQRRRMQFDERRLMIEKGMTPPPLPEPTKRSPDASLRVGIMLLMLGVGFAVAGFFGPGNSDKALWVAAAIVGSLGLGNLFYYAIVKKQPQSLPPAA